MSRFILFHSLMRPRYSPLTPVNSAVSKGLTNLIPGVDTLPVGIQHIKTRKFRSVGKMIYEEDDDMHA